MIEWIDRDDRLPAYPMRVLVATFSNNVVTCTYAGEGEFKNGDVEIENFDVSHWANLPSLPERKERFKIGFSGMSTASPINISCGDKVFLIHATQSDETVRFVKYLNEIFDKVGL